VLKKECAINKIQWWICTHWYEQKGRQPSIWRSNSCAFEVINRLQLCKNRYKFATSPIKLCCLDDVTTQWACPLCQRCPTNWMPIHIIYINDHIHKEILQWGFQQHAPNHDNFTCIHGSGQCVWWWGYEDVTDITHNWNLDLEKNKI